MIKIIEKNVDELIPYENNARINDEAVKYVANSIREFGFKNPCIVDKDNVIVAGHTRVLAAKSLGIEKVPCIIADDLTEEQIKAFRIADNSSGQIAEWDMHKLMKELETIDYDMSNFGLKEQMAEIESIIEKQMTVDEDDYEEPEDLEPKAKLGDIYQLGEHRLMCGDSTKEEDVKKLMNQEIADLLFTDPPYNVDVSNSQGMKIKNDNMGDAEFKKFLSSAFKCASASLKKGGAFYIWFADSEDINFRISAIENGLLVKQCLIWVKNGFNFGRQDYKWQHEPCLYGWKDGAGHYFVEEYNNPTVIEDKIDFEKLKKEEMKHILEEIFSDKLAKTIIHEKKPLKNDLHPTMKPLKMCGKLIQHSTKKDEKVLDLFGGSGSTLIVCEQINRKCYMMEYDPHYVDVIIDRWEKFTGKKAVKIC